MDFNISSLKAGFRLRRKCWPEKQWIALGQSRNITKQQLHHEALRKIQDYKPDLEAEILPFIIARDSKGNITMGWMIGQVDLLADDWEIRHEEDKP